ncbi:hypothetical protein [Pseudomonas putida]|uniref:hypothetical protein n=1 Tax=Pseudomonas putida TaxID=303 RepID=UPI003D9521E5
MKRCVSGVILLALSSTFGQLAHAQDPLPQTPLQVAQSLPNSGNNNPYNSPIRRANPNSMQGTQPSAPAIRSPNTVPVPRPPTLDNGGIGNRYPQSQSAPAGTPKFIPNPAPRN